MNEELIIELNEDLIDISISENEDGREILQEISNYLDLINGEVI